MRTTSTAVEDAEHLGVPRSGGEIMDSRPTVSSAVSRSDRGYAGSREAIVGIVRVPIQGPLRPGPAPHGMVSAPSSARGLPTLRSLGFLGGASEVRVVSGALERRMESGVSDVSPKTLRTNSESGHMGGRSAGRVFVAAPRNDHARRQVPITLTAVRLMSGTPSTSRIIMIARPAKRPSRVRTKIPRKRPITTRTQGGDSISESRLPLRRRSGAGGR